MKRISINRKIIALWFPIFFVCSFKGLAQNNIDNPFGQATSEIDTTPVLYHNELINRYDTNCLKIGKWIDFDQKYNNEIKGFETKIVQYGNYKVIFISDTISHLNDKFHSYYYYHNEKGKLTSYYDNKKGNWFSVKHGQWIFSPNREKVEAIDEWNYGVKTKRMSFENGEIEYVQCFYIDNGLEITDKYLKWNDEVFMRQYYDSLGMPHYLYYPDKEISLKEATLYSTATLNSTDTVWFDIYSNSTSILMVDTLIYNREQLTAIDITTKECDTFQILPKDTMSLGFVYKPNRCNLRRSEPIMVVCNNEHYNLEISTRAFDLHSKNVKKTSVIELTRISENKLFLYVQDVGWHTRIEIFDANEKELLKSVFIGECRDVAIDVSDFNVGMYKLIAKSNENYKIDLIIK